jgi:hypothetical protein
VGALLSKPHPIDGTERSIRYKRHYNPEKELTFCRLAPEICYCGCRQQGHSTQSSGRWSRLQRVSPRRCKLLECFSFGARPVAVFTFSCPLLSRLDDTIFASATFSFQLRSVARSKWAHIDIDFAMCLHSWYFVAI